MAESSRLKQRYEERIRPQLMEELGYTNIWEVPCPMKVSVTTGVSEATTNFETLENAINELALILGQRPCLTRARQSIATFGVRAGQAIGCKATLRGKRMWEFMDRLFNVVIPRIHDFRGLPRKAFDGRGNYTIGINDHMIFPELGYDDVEKTRGLSITIVTTAQSDEAGIALLTALGLPLRSE